MRARHALSAALCGLLLSCQGPAAVLAEDAARAGGDVSPRHARDCRSHRGSAAGSAAAPASHP